MSGTPKAASQNLAPERDIGPLFLANFVHQVINPINGVIGTLDNINDKTYSGAIAEQKINACRGQLEQCVTLIRNLAYLSDYFFDVPGKEALRQSRETGLSVLPQVIIEALQFFQIAANKKNMRIELTDAVTQYRVKLRPELLKQVFINLFDNWLKYGSNDQVVEVSPTVNSKNELVIEILGASIGFDNNDAEKIFELGFRSKEAVSKLAQGSGIGLYVCKQIVVQALTGQISAEHQRRKGVTKFRISIPQYKWQI